MAGGAGGDTEPVAPRSTASQMQRGSGELQSTPTGFWKLQSDPAGAGHGSIAAGIGAWSLLRSASLTAHMGRSHTHTRGRGRGPDAEIQKIQSSGEKTGVFFFFFFFFLVVLLWDPPVSQESELPVSWIQSIAFRGFNPTSSTSQPVAPDLRESALRDSLTHIHTLSEGSSPEEAEGGLLGSRWRSVCGAGIRGRSGFTTDTHTEQLTASLPLVSGDVLHTKPLCPPPKHTLLSQRAGSSVSPPSHCPLSLSLSPLCLSFLFSSLFILTAKQIPSSHSHLSVPNCLYLSQHLSGPPSLFCFLFPSCFRYSIHIQTITPTTRTGPTIISKQTTVLLYS